MSHAKITQTVNLNAIVFRNTFFSGSLSKKEPLEKILISLSLWTLPEQLTELTTPVLAVSDLAEDVRNIL